MRSAVILVGKERQTKTEWVTALLGRDLRNFGIADSSTIVLKSNQEPALVDLLKDVQRWRVEKNSRATTTIEHSSVHDSKSNGFVERGVQSFEQIFRTHKLDLERKVGKGVDQSWLGSRSTLQICTIRAMSTRMERRLMRNFGEEYKGEMLLLGCQVLHRVIGKLIGGVVAPRWLPGTWVGEDLVF